MQQQTLYYHYFNGGVEKNISTQKSLILESLEVKTPQANRLRPRAVFGSGRILCFHVKTRLLIPAMPSQTKIKTLLFS